MMKHNPLQLHYRSNIVNLSSNVCVRRSCMNVHSVSYDSGKSTDTRQCAMVLAWNIQSPVLTNTWSETMKGADNTTDLVPIIS